MFGYEKIEIIFEEMTNPASKSHPEVDMAKPKLWRQTVSERSIASVKICFEAAISGSGHRKFIY
jgi:hypothetical protein